MSKPPRSRTSISTESLPAVQIPPTKIENDEMRLDPQKVIKAWLSSAEVLRDVAAAVRENQEDNEVTRTAIEKTQRAMVLAGVIFTIFQALSVGAVVTVTMGAEEKISKFVRDQTAVNEEVRDEARKTRQEAENIRQEAKVMTKAVAAALQASVAAQGDGDEAEVERALLEAEVTVAAAQAQMTDDPKVKARSKEKAKAALKRAKTRSQVIGPVSVDSELIEDL